MVPENPAMRVVICGGGVVGASIAYFLGRLGARPIVVERTGVACAASGKSGGFLALDWCDGTPLEQLARRSFELHAELAQRIDMDWGYRRMVTYSGSASEHQNAQRATIGTSNWLAEGVALDRRLGSTDTTAQVHPAQFAAAMMHAAQAQGAELRLARVTGLMRSGSVVTGVETDGGKIEGDAVVIAMGPWSVMAASWLPLPAVFGLKGHSLVFDTGTTVPAEALFLEYQEATGVTLSPEVFPRSDGTTYVCAISSESALPIDPSHVVPDEGAIERLEAMSGRLSPALNGAKILARQACYRPVTQDGLPLIGRIAGLDGAFVATGHSVWGILNAPATGEAMADLIVHGASRNVDLSPFDPARLRPLDPKQVECGSPPLASTQD
jgi:glycine/D-amino acid oxidase-like deaminating enzyme